MITPRFHALLRFSGIVPLVFLGLVSGAAAQDRIPSIAEVYTNPALSQAPDPSLDAVLAFASGFAPSIAISVTKAAYVNGEAVLASEFKLRNPNSQNVPVEIKLWLDVPGQPPISLINLGADGSLSFPANFDQNLAPLQLFAVDPSFARGAYSVGARVIDPITGELYSQDVNPFVLQ
jgi:hypothetical protein